MNKMLICIFMCAVIFSSILSVYAEEKKAYSYYYITALEMQEGKLGTWTVQGGDEASLSPILQGATTSRPQETIAAEISIEVKEKDKYYVWARTKDFADRPGTRHCQIMLNHQSTNASFGGHGIVGWGWDVSQGVLLGEGDNDISLVDTSASYSRVDCIIVTNNPSFVPPGKKDDLMNQYTKYKATASKPVGLKKPPKPTLLPKPEGQVSLILNEKEMLFDVPPEVKNGRTMVPMRKLFEAVSADVAWDDETQTVTAKRGSMIIKMTIGRKEAYVNGVMNILDQEPYTVDGRTLIPVRFVSEALKANVSWDEEIKLVNVTMAGNSDFIFLRPQSFSNTGSWTLETSNVAAFEGTSLRGSTNAANNGTMDFDNPATTEILIEEDATYKIWVHARDYATNQPGSRFFNVAVGDTKLERTFGQHGKEGYIWEDGGNLNLKAGKVTVKLLDTSNFYGRCDAILITKNLKYQPNNSYEAITKMVPPLDIVRDDLFFPDFARSAEKELESYTIGNDKTRVNFFKVPTADGKIIQKETQIFHNGKWIKVEDRTQGFGYFLIRADKSSPRTVSAQYPVFNQELNGQKVSTPIIFDSGKSSWVIPDTMSRIDENTVLVSKETEYGILSALWQLDQDSSEPLVTCKFKATVAGAYSIGMFNTGETAKENVDYMLAPFKIHSQRFLDNPMLISEQFAFSPYSGITIKESASPIENEKITYAVIVDPSSIPRNHWAQLSDSLFGMNVLGPNKGALPGVFAPLFGGSESNFSVGTEYEIKYRPVIQVGEWFDSYRHVVEDIYKLTNYRKNYYSSLTDAIFNTRKLMLDDKFSGWDNNSKEHYNMEGRNTTSQANPLEALQSYLLSEDDDMLRRRVIPTLASLLTRSNVHFVRDANVAGGADYWANKDLPTAIGTPISGFNTSTFTGAYMMTRGLTPALYQPAAQVPVRFTNAYGSIPDFVEYIAKYKFTNDQEYLAIAKQKADEYILKNITEPSKVLPGHSTFIYISYYPHLPSLLDIYEVTKEQKYLDAAIETAHMLVTTLWLSGTTNLTDEDQMTIKAEDVKAYSYNDNAKNFWWFGDKQWRLGSEPGVLGRPQNLDILKDETVPTWLPQRVGLGLEQASTFGKSYNIIMSNFTGDLMRLSKYANDELLETYARNAMIGRFSNYTGYYIGNFLVHQMKPDYPYTGPDYTSIYQHHIPTFLSMLEDYLISQAWAWSNENIDFPGVRMHGYAYFNNRQYGFKPGKFFNEKDVWLWLKDDIMKADNVQVDWLAARKNGTLCLALMNEDHVAVTSKIKLGGAVNSSYTGKATLYQADGSASEIDIVNGEFTVTIPSNKLLGVVIKMDGIKAPAYADTDFETMKSKDFSQAIVEHEAGKGMILQVDKSKYFAYTYITDKSLEKAVLNYKIGNGEWKKEEIAAYPYEFITEVSDPKLSFTYNIDVYEKGGNQRNSGTRILKPIE